MHRFVLATFAALALSCGTGPESPRGAANPPAAALDMDPDRLAGVPVRMRELVDEGEIAGAVLLLVRREGIVLLEAVGFRDLEAREPMRTDAIFRMASVAKPVTALGIMMLQEEGRLLVNDAVAWHLPAFQGLSVEVPEERTGPIRLRHLLTHTSGLATERALFEPAHMGMTLADVVATYAMTPLAAPPGTRFIYSSPGFDILGRVIEVVSGEPYEAFMAARVFGPLGMEDSGFFVPAGKRDRLPGFYRHEDGGLREGARPDSYAGDLPHEGRVFPAPAYGLYSTASDLAALLRMMLNDGLYEGVRLLSPASILLMTSDQSDPFGVAARNGFEISPWGFGWSVARLPGVLGGLFGSAGAYGHNGSTGVRIWVDPGKNLAGAFLVHQADRESARAANVFQTMAGAAVIDRGSSHAGTR